MSLNNGVTLHAASMLSRKISTKTEWCSTGALRTVQYKAAHLLRLQYLPAVSFTLVTPYYLRSTAREFVESFAWFPAARILVSSNPTLDRLVNKVEDPPDRANPIQQPTVMSMERRGVICRCVSWVAQGSNRGRVSKQ